MKDRAWSATAHDSNCTTTDDRSRAGSVVSSAYDGCVLTNEDKQWLSERLEGLSEKIEKVETSLLTEFHKWASPQEMRQRTHAAAIRALDA